MPASTFVKGVAVTTSDIIRNNPTYTDPFAEAPALRLASPFASIPELGAYKPGQTLGGLDWDQAASLTDLRALSDYEVNVPALSLPDAIAALPGVKGSVRTGSFEINMLDIPETIRMATGQTIGQQEPLLGTPGSTGNIVSDFALEFLNQYSTMPGKLADYGIAVPVMWGGAILGQRDYAKGPVNPDATPVYKFQNTPDYWDMLRAVGSDEQLHAVAYRTAQNTVSGAMVPGLAAQLFDIFKRDQNALTGMSSGNERIDYLAKKLLASTMDVARKGGDLSVVGGLNPLDPAFFARWGGGVNQLAATAASFLPEIGTDLAQTLMPVGSDVEAQWAALSPQSRLLLQQQAGYAMLGTDLVVALPLFNGIGAFFNIARAGAVPNAAFESSRFASSNALGNAVREAAWNLGRIGVDIPDALQGSRVWGMGNSLARLAKPGGSLASAGRLSLIPDGYEAALAGARLMMAEGIAAWTANWAAKAFVPGYSQELGRQIDNSHWVSESNFAAIVDNVGLMAGGAFGAATFYRATKGAFGWTGERMGFRYSPVMDMHETTYGEAVQKTVARVFDLPENYLTQPFRNHVLSLLERNTENQVGLYALRMVQAGKSVEEAEQYLAENATNIHAVAEQIVSLIKKASDGSMGPVARNAAREAMNELGMMMEAETGVSRWGERLLPRGWDYSPAGFAAWMRHTAGFIGWDPAKVDTLSSELSRAGRILPKSERGQMDNWRKAANGMAQYAYDHFNARLKAIVDSGTSEDAAKLQVIRNDHLWRGDAQAYLDAFDAFEKGTVDEAAVTTLKNQLMRTTELREWWANRKPGKYESTFEGERNLEAATPKQVANFVAQIKEALLVKRVTPGPDSVPGPLNDLHLLLEQHGDWTLAYKGEAPTALATIKAQSEQAQALADAWDQQLGALQAEMDRTKQVWRPIQDALYDKYLHSPRMLEEEAKLTVTRDAQNAAWRAVADWKYQHPEVNYLRRSSAYRALEKAYDDAFDAHNAQVKAFDRYYDAQVARLGKVQNRHPAFKAMRAAEDAHLDFYNSNPRPMGLRVGPVAPSDFIWDPLGDEMMVLDAATSDYVRNFSDTDPPGFYHATVHRQSVLEHGLLNHDEMRALGLPGHMGTGGGAREYESSTTVSLTHAQAWVDRLKMMARIVNGKAGIDDVFDHFAVHYPAEGFDDIRTILQYVDLYGTREHRLRASIDADVAELTGRYARVSSALGHVRSGGDDLSRYEVYALDGKFVGYRDPNLLVDTPVAKTLNEYRKWLDDQADYWKTRAAEARQKGDDFIDSPEAWDWLRQDLIDSPPQGMDMHGLKKGDPLYEARIAAELLRDIDGRLPQEPGGQVLITGDPWAKFHGILNEDDIGIVRVAVNAADGHSIHPGADYWGGEVALRSDHTFVYRPLPGQPYDAPIAADPLTDWSQAGPLTRPVTHLVVRDPETGEVTVFKAPYRDYPTSGADQLNVTNRNVLARKLDDVFRGFRSWRIGQYQRGQLFRILSTRYDVTPEQIDALDASMARLGWERWSPIQGRLALPMGKQAASRFRETDVNAMAARIFGRIDTGRKDVNGNPIFEPAPLRNKLTGKLETPNFAELAGDAYRQAWTISLTSGLTNRLYAINALSVGHAGMLLGTWLVPIVRYVASPIFKMSEIWESKGFNWMRLSRDVKPEDMAAWRAMGLETPGIGMELRSGELMGEVQALSQPSAPAPEAMMAGLDAIDNSHRVASLLRASARRGATDPGTPGALRRAWDYVANPTPAKDRLQTQMAVQTLSREFPAILRAGDRAAYDFYHTQLAVPDAELASFVMADRLLLQRWIDGTGSFDELIAHAAKFNKGFTDEPGLTAFYRSPEWQATEAMLKLGVRSAQQEAYGVHYFGSYRSAFERSVNHPLLGVYPASWAYKAAKEWFKFLFDNHTFGEGALNLGAVPAAYLQEVMQGQARMVAMTSDQDLSEWMRRGPLANSLFVFNLLMPGDWSNIPFPASRSIRMLLRGNFDPRDHLMQNLFGPQGSGGIGAIRDLNLIRLVGTDIGAALDESKNQGRWQQILEGLDKTGKPPKVPKWEDITRFPTPVQGVPPLSEPIR